jgi:biopolymer transport protein ExbD
MRFRKKRHLGDPELNIIPFLNVMVVLIAFLLVNAVFAAVAVLDINLPARTQSTSTPPPNKPQVALEIMVYKDHLLVDDRHAGPLKQVDNVAGKPDLDGLHSFLLELKQRFPDVKNITLLCEDNIPYQLLISVMDTVRYQSETVAGHAIRRPLFPDINIGSAPPPLPAPAATTSQGGKS